MSKTLTLTFDGEYELLLKAVEAYAKSDSFTDDEGRPVTLTSSDIALQMLLQGCIDWMHEVEGLPEELESEIRETFGVEDACCDFEDEEFEDEDEEENGDGAKK
jgi:hypothetical protein